MPPTTKQLSDALPPETMLHERYRILGTLGQGGFGITYLATHEALKMTVVVKEYFLYRSAARHATSKEVVPLSPQAFQTGLESFLKEARLLTQFDHANIVRVLDLFLENGTAYYVMPFYEGQTLEAYLHTQGGTLTEEVVKPLFRPIIDGLKEAHQKGILHRDIKPENIYLAHTPFGGVNPILLDFGSARELYNTAFTVLVTPDFAPLEQYDPSAKQDARVDVYSVCATMYFALSGQLVPQATTRANAEETWRGLEELPISDPLKHTLYEGLALKAKDRIPSLQVLSEKLYGNDRLSNFAQIAFVDTRPLPKLDEADIPTFDQNSTQNIDFAKTRAIPTFDQNSTQNIDFAKTRAIPTFDTKIAKGIQPTRNIRSVLIPVSAVLLFGYLGALGYQNLRPKTSNTTSSASESPQIETVPSVAKPKPQAIEPPPLVITPPSVSERNDARENDTRENDIRENDPIENAKQARRAEDAEIRARNAEIKRKKRIQDIAIQREHERLKQANKREIEAVKDKIRDLQAQETPRNTRPNRRTNERQNRRETDIQRNVKAQEMQELQRQLRELKQKENTRQSRQRRNLSVQGTFESARNTATRIRNRIETIAPKRDSRRN